MKLKDFFWTSEVITSFCWVLFFVILIFINPYRASIAVFITFFLSLFIAIFSTVSLLNLRLLIKKSGGEGIKKKMFVAGRHGGMVAIVLVGLLLMKALDVLGLWEGIVFVLSIFLIEGYFWSKSEE